MTVRITTAAPVEAHSQIECSIFDGFTTEIVSRFAPPSPEVSQRNYPHTYPSDDGLDTESGSRYLRWVLTECARTHIRLNPDSNLTHFYLKLMKRKGDAKAIVAASTKLLNIAYWLLKENRPYHS
jgi:hypothetical protein